VTNPQTTKGVIALTQFKTAPVSPRVCYLTDPGKIDGIPRSAVPTAREVAERFAFRANDYYLGLIDWKDPEDPIRRLIVPHRDELTEWGALDASNEKANTVVAGVQHKYRDTALVLASRTCAAFCRFCFRKRLFLDGNEETALDLDEAVAYIGAHPEITDVLLTGGDVLVLPTRWLRRIVAAMASVPHVRTIRLGSKMAAFNPFRILDDPSLADLITEFSTEDRAIYLMAHFDHPRELTPEAREAIAAVQQAGAHVVNQCPLIRGVNDHVDTLVELFETTTRLGLPQYYLFQGRPTAGNRPYVVPIVRGWKLFDRARRQCSGLSRRLRFAMSHATGKIEILGVDDRHVYLRYHRARDAADESRIFVRKRHERAAWLDELPAVGTGPAAAIAAG